MRLKIMNNTMKILLKTSTAADIFTGDFFYQIIEKNVKLVSKRLNIFSTGNQ